MWASGSAGGRAAGPEHAAPATAAPAAKARRKADKRRAAADNAAGSSAYDSEAPSEGRPSKRLRAAAAGAPGGDAAVAARAALGAAEAEARSAGEAVDEDDDGGDARAALRRLGVRSADPRYAAALAHERADLAKQARCLGLCPVVSHALSVGQAEPRALQPAAAHAQQAARLLGELRALVRQRRGETLLGCRLYLVERLGACEQDLGALPRSAAHTCHEQDGVVLKLTAAHIHEWMPQAATRITFAAM